jgi:tRNA(Ile)-lysidine synthase
VARLAETCRKHGLLERAPVAVAVSGGPDSMALMVLLAELAWVPLVVVSIDHGLRPESAGEVAAVARSAEKLGLPFRTTNLMLQPGPGLQSRARAARFQWLDALPEPTVALGHHLDDQAETVLDRLVRGSGSRGLSAMQPRRGRYVRPLLGFRRAELRAFLRGRGVSWIEDPSNVKGTRGALRHSVLPRLEEIRPGAATGLARSSQLLAADDRLLQALAEPLCGPEGIKLAAWRGEPEPLRRRAVLALCPSITAKQIDAVLGLERPGAWVEVSGAWRLAHDGTSMRLLPPPPGPATLTQGEWGLWRVQASEPVALRSPRPGEDAGGTPLRERLRAAGIGPALRRYHPVVERGGRRWVPGVWSEGGTNGGGSRVVVVRPAVASVPAGGPFQVAL